MPAGGKRKLSPRATPATWDRHELWAGEPVLRVEPDPGGQSWCVRALGLQNHAPGFASNPRLRVRVAEGGEDDDLPDVSGTLEMFTGEIRFVPDFPFRPGVRFRAILDLCGADECRSGAVIVREFSLSEKEMVEEARVTRVYPSLDVVPENLLRFTVRFSGPMSRGCAERHVELLGPDGSPLPDVLYRAPVELWDRSMTILTILLDPGRLKRGVGPHRMLGSPLKAGQDYTLTIGPGMIDARGRRLAEGFSKRFSVGEPVRQSLATEAWSVSRVAAGSRDPLELTFPWPLDWAQLRHGIIVTSQPGEPVDGTNDVDLEERRWRFIPRHPWRPGTYRFCVSPTLEDWCGNTTSGPFDGPLRSAEDVLRETAIRSTEFVVDRGPPGEPSAEHSTT